MEALTDRSRANIIATASIARVVRYVAHASIAISTLLTLLFQKPFPDKSFYVFDGKPFCEYHYHEANNSLCASPRCGMPIEGPCAVAHSGDRYHPAHFVCESPSCKERLDDEYWEIDGTRLCDKHARSHPMFEESQAPSESGGRDDSRDSLGSVSSYDPGHASMARARKRMTRYVDL